MGATSPTQIASYATPRRAARVLVNQSVTTMSPTRPVHIVFAAIAGVLLWNLVAMGQNPEFLTVQGQLTDSEGTPLSGTHTLRFRLFGETPTHVFEQTESVALDDGIYSVDLGPLQDVVFDRAMGLGIKVDAEPELPLQMTRSAPYALGMRGWRVQYVRDPADVTSYNMAGGSYVNTITEGVIGGTIGGGGASEPGFSSPNVVGGNFGTVSGGVSNQALGANATVGGGFGNFTSGSSSVVSGGQTNSASQFYVTIGGGINNQASGFASTIAGGSANQANHGFTSIGGGYDNVASGEYATIPGGYLNRATAVYSFAAGHRAGALHPGSFVWADNSSSDAFSTTVGNVFIVRAQEGMGINEPTPQASLHVRTYDLAIQNKQLYQEEIVAEAVDAVVGLYSGGSGDWGSGIALAEVSGGTLTNKWGIVRATAAGGNALNFTFGSNTDYATNNTVMKLSSAGALSIDGNYSSGGADLAERVRVVGSLETYEPGDVMVVSTRSDRSFERSATPYATAVAGVYATRPGLVLGDGASGPVEDGPAIPMGVVGIVPTKVSAENGPIHRGDLLVTSATPGHAMRADPHRLGFGMVLGKALETFKGPGTGVIEILVSVK